MTQPSHHNIARLLPSPFFFVWLAAFFCSLLWFDIEWCAFTSFRPFKAYISLYAFLPAVACLLAIPALTTRRWYIPAIWLLLIDMLLVANLMYARTYMVQIPLESYLIVSNLKGFESAVIESLRWGDMGFLLIIAASIFFARKYAPQSKPMRGWPLASFAAVTLLFCAGAYTTLALRGGFVKRLAKMRSSATDQMTITPVYTPFSVMLYDFMSLDKPISDSEKKLVAQWLKEHKSITDSYSPSESAPKSLIVILCESLESWPIGMSIEGKEITPFLNSLVADSATYFNPNVLTQVKDGRSIDAQLIYLAGQMPLASGVYSTKHAAQDWHAIPSLMKQHGASTLLFSSDYPTVWNQKTVAQNFGIDSLYMAPQLNGSPDNDGTYMDDKQLMCNSINVINSLNLFQQGHTFFAMWVTHTGHFPFNSVTGQTPLRLAGNYPSTLKDYIETTSFVDEALRILISYIRSLQDSDKIAIAIVGDHEGLASHRKQLSKQFKWVSPEQLTPLILINSGHSGHDSKTIGQADVYAALLEAAGIYNLASWKGMGISPFSASHPGFAIGSRGNAFAASDSDSIPSHTANHMRQAFSVSDIMIRYHLQP